MTIDSILILETPEPSHFYPFSVLHPTWELRTGKYRLFEMVRRAFPETSIHFLGRGKQTLAFLDRFELANEKTEGATLVLKAETLFDNELAMMIRSNLMPESPCALPTTDGKIWGWIFPDSMDADAWLLSREEVPANLDFEISATVFDFLWETLDRIVQSLVSSCNEISTWRLSETDPRLQELRDIGVVILNPTNVFLSPTAQLEPNVVLDARSGVQIFDEHSQVMANSSIRDSFYLGKNALVKMGAKIYGATVIGDSCKVAGEISNSIFQGFSNKAHDGYVGNSFICEWVNLGAGTNTANLRTFSDLVPVRHSGRQFNSGRTFLGFLAGDYTKTCINAMTAPGCVSGVCSVIGDTGFALSDIPHFSFGGKKGSPTLSISRAIGICESMMARRNSHLSRYLEEIIRELS